MLIRLVNCILVKKWLRNKAAPVFFATILGLFCLQENTQGWARLEKCKATWRSENISSFQPVFLPVRLLLSFCHGTAQIYYRPFHIRRVRLEFGKGKFLLLSPPKVNNNLQESIDSLIFLPYF